MGTELQLVESSTRSVRLLSVSVDKYIKRSVLLPQPYTRTLNPEP
jgi:hypothetical protein